MGAAENWTFAPAYELPSWPFVAPPDLAHAPGGERIRYPVVIAGAGLAGLTLACDLAQRGVQAIVLDEDDTIGVKGASSRGICYAQKSLETFDRLGIWPRIRDKGVTWSVGRTFSGADEVFSFDLEDDSVSRQPPFVNLQQFYLEWFLVDRILEQGTAELRWKSKVGAVEDIGECVVVEVETPAGRYALEAEWFVDASGANSAIRNAMGLEVNPSRSTDRWCITDVRFKKPFPTERWTWIDAPFNEGRAVWQHLMADGVWRLDYQMSETADAETISRPEVAGERIRAQLGDDVEFEFVWIGPYQYRDHLLERFRVGRVLFVGDSAHVVSPFGARGGNNGIQDAANLGWKLALVLQGRAGEALIDSYHDERWAAAVENLVVCRRTARFLAPRSKAEHRIRRAVATLARRHPFARKLANTGRMAQANAYPSSPCAPDGARSVQNVAFAGTTLMRRLGDGTVLLGVVVADAVSARPGATASGGDAEAGTTGRGAGAATPTGEADATGPGDVPAALRALEARHPVRFQTLRSDDALVRQFGAVAPGAVVLVRPDAYVARIVDGGADGARGAAAVEAALRAALALPAAGAGAGA